MFCLKTRVHFFFETSYTNVKHVKFYDYFFLFAVCASKYDSWNEWNGNNSWEKLCHLRIINNICVNDKVYSMFICVRIFFYVWEHQYMLYYSFFFWRLFCYFKSQKISCMKKVQLVHCITYVKANFTPTHSAMQQI